MGHQQRKQHGQMVYYFEIDKGTGRTTNGSLGDGWGALRERFELTGEQVAALQEGEEVDLGEYVLEAH